ncbi:MAG: class I SAM-dependent methyltransferase [Thermodesulfovibrionales bacterium]|jgi:SAM-dependent methyltransferase
MNYQKYYYPESQFGGFTDIDGTIAFFSRVNELVQPSFTIIDFGCGRGAYKDDSINLRRNLRILGGKAKEVIGIDIDRAAEVNPFIDRFILSDHTNLSVDDESIDMIICDNVMEHLDNPELFFAEAKRVLKVNGYLCIRTPNVYNYIALMSKIIPKRYHLNVLSVTQKVRKCEDVFEAYYKCNSVNKICTAMDKYGFDSVVYGYEAEPSYLSCSKLAYFFGVLHQRYAPSFCRATIFAFGKKRS